MDALTSGQLLQTPLDPGGSGEPPQFVFSATVSGDMTSASAKVARSFYKAGRSNGGWRGNSYGIPIGRAADDVFPLVRIEQQYERFFDLAKRNPSVYFQFPRVAAGQRSGRPEYEPRLARLAAHRAPDNVLLPGSWLAAHKPLCRLFVYAETSIDSSTAFRIFDGVVGPKLARIGKRDCEVVVPPRQQGAGRAVAYAKHQSIAYRLLNHPNARISRSDTLISAYLFWYATDVVLIYNSDRKDEPDEGLYHYADWALQQRLNVRYIDVQQAKYLL